MIVSNQFPLKGTDKFYTAYAGANDILSGKTAAEMLLKACADAKIKCGKGAIIRFRPAFLRVTIASPLRGCREGQARRDLGDADGGLPGRRRL